MGMHGKISHVVREEKILLRDGAMLVPAETILLAPFRRLDRPTGGVIALGAAACRRVLDSRLHALDT